MTNFGYARVSSGRQETENQVPLLRQAGCDEIVEEVISGASRELPLRDALLAKLESGDTLTVVAVDRLGRRALDVLRIAEDLDTRGVSLRLLREGADTSTPSGRMMLGIMASFAEMEREVLIERTNAGLDRARKAGKILGRPTVLTPQRVDLIGSLTRDGRTIDEIVDLVGISRASVVRARRLYRESVDQTPPAVA